MTTQIPSTRTLYVEKEGHAVAHQVHVPEVKADEVLIAVKAVSINPIDFIQMKFKLAEGAGMGCNFAGEVVQVGEDVKDWAVGDTTAGSVPGADVDRPEVGAFTNFLVIKGEQLFHIPEKLGSDISDEISVGYPGSFEQASTLGLTLETAAVGFEFNDKIPIVKDSQSGYILIYSAASSLGFAFCQVAKYIGYNVIGVASKKNAKDLRHIGVDHILDYHDKDWQEQVKKIAGDDLTIAFDCYSKQESVDAVWDLLSSTKPAKLSAFLTDPKPTKEKPNAKFDDVLYYHLFHDIKKMGPDVLAADPSVLPYAASIFQHINQMFATKSIKSQQTKVVGNSLDDVPHALELWSKGVSNEKLVVRFK